MERFLLLEDDQTRDSVVDRIRQGNNEGYTVNHKGHFKGRYTYIDHESKVADVALQFSMSEEAKKIV